MWRESIFNVRVEAGSGTTLYNVRTGRLVVLHASLDRILAARPALESHFREMGFLVDQSHSDQEEYESFLNERAKPTGGLYVLFTTTTTCDLTCGYCFQNRIRRSVMSDSVLEAAFTWLEGRIRETAARRVSMTLFGGEPMLEAALSLRALEGVRRICDGTGARLEDVLLTTNGLHADRTELEGLRRAGVMRAQVTLDGDRPVNDARRLLRTVERAHADVYQRVLGNLKLYEELFQLVVKINFDKTTLASVPMLLDELLSVAGLSPGRFAIKIEPIAISKRSQKGAQDRIYDPREPEMADAFAFLIREASTRRIPLDLSAMFPTPCMVSSENSFLLEPDGNLRSCISAFGLDAFKVGSVQEPSKSLNDRTRFRTAPDTPDIQSCLERRCSYLPVCDGGCKYEQHLEGEPLSRMQCKADYFAAAVPLFVRYHLGKARVIEHYDLPRHSS